MTYYNLINGVHNSESKELTFDILRNEFGYNYIVMIDWVIDINSGIIRNEFGYNYIVMIDWVIDINSGIKYPNAYPHKVIRATGDIFMPGTADDYNDILEAIENGSLTLEELEKSASKIYNLAKEIEL